MPRPPWLKPGLSLDQRIDAAMPEVISIVRPSEGEDKDWCIGIVRAALRDIIAKDDSLRRPKVVQKQLLNAAAKLREGLAGAVFDFREDAETIERVAGRTEEWGRSLVDHRRREGRRRKDVAVGFAHFILKELGTRGQPTAYLDGYWVQLATVMYEAATGTACTGNFLWRAVTDYNRSVSDQTGSASRGRPSASGPSRTSNRRRR